MCLLCLFSGTYCDHNHIAKQNISSMIKNMELKDVTKEAVLVGLNSTLEEAVKKMITDKTNALVVVNEEGKFAGEVNVSDLFDAIIPEYLDGDAVLEHFASEETFAEAVKDASGKFVEDFVSLNADPVFATDSIVQVASSAVAHQHTRIPVVDHDNRPIGIISRHGLKHILAEYLGIEEREEKK